MSKGRDRRPSGGPEGLRVYHLAQRLGLAIDLVVKSCQVDPDLARQLLRAAASVILNIAEGAAHSSPGRKRYFYETARGSAGECVAGLTHILRKRPCPAATNARRMANMVCIMLRPLIEGLDSDG